MLLPAVGVPLPPSILPLPAPPATGGLAEALVLLDGWAAEGGLIVEAEPGPPPIGLMLVLLVVLLVLVGLLVVLSEPWKMEKPERLSFIDSHSAAIWVRFRGPTPAAAPAAPPVVVLAAGGLVVALPPPELTEVPAVVLPPVAPAVRVLPAIAPLAVSVVPPAVVLLVGAPVALPPTVGAGVVAITEPADGPVGVTVAAPVGVPAVLPAVLTLVRVVPVRGGVSPGAGCDPSVCFFPAKQGLRCGCPASYRCAAGNDGLYAKQQRIGV